MGCGGCSCGHNDDGANGSGPMKQIGAALLVLVIGVVGLAMALQPGTPAKKDAPKQAQPSAPAAPKTDKLESEAKSPPSAAVSPYVLGYSMKRIDGTEESLEAYKGKVVLMVNVASKCGYTKQYDGLEKLYKDKKDAGLVILGFPANNFGQQEPGSNTEIAEFCKSKFNVTFPLFEKISVMGADQHALYKQLAAQAAPIGGDPKWNFTKFLVDRTGNVVGRFDSKIAPDNADLNKRIDELLAKK